MSKVKKLLAMLMAVVMTLGMSVTAFAAANNTISVTGTGIDTSAVVSYGKIIEENRSSTLGWKFVEENIMVGEVQTTIEDAFVNAWNSTEPTTNLTAEQVIDALIADNMKEDPVNKNVTNGTISNSAKLNAALAAVASAATNTMTDQMSDDQFVAKVTPNTLTKGLYVITAHKEGYTYLPMAAYIDTEGTGVDVVAKGSEDQIMKTIAGTGDSVAPGDEVSYTIKQQYLYISPDATDKTFTITDKITNGTIKAGTIKVYVTDNSNDILTDDDKLEETTEYGLNYLYENTSNPSEITGFVVDLGGSKYQSEFAGDTVQITYDVTVGNVTTSAPLRNVASSSNGSGAIVETEPVAFKVIKQDDKTQEKLQGAKFQIYKQANQDDDNAVKLTLEDGTEVYGVTVGSEITTDHNGEATVNNLDAQGVYYVKETYAPEKYSLNDFAYPLTGANVTQNPIGKEEVGGVEYTKITYTYTDFSDITVDDTKLASLPSTGGIGTTIFTIGGCLIMIVAAGLFFATRRKAEK